jgi:hypothetical protein
MGEENGGHGAAGGSRFIGWVPCPLTLAFYDMCCCSPLASALSWISQCIREPEAALRMHKALG